MSLRAYSVEKHGSDTVRVNAVVVIVSGGRYLFPCIVAVISGHQRYLVPPMRRAGQQSFRVKRPPCFRPRLQRLTIPTLSLEAPAPEHPLCASRRLEARIGSAHDTLPQVSGAMICVMSAIETETEGLVPRQIGIVCASKCVLCGQHQRRFLR